MTAHEFIAWAIEQPKRPRYELVVGELGMTAPERAAHARVKAAVWYGLVRAFGWAFIQVPLCNAGLAIRTLGPWTRVNNLA